MAVDVTVAGLDYLGPCHCICGHWGHTGICAGEARVRVPFVGPDGGSVEVEMCVPCARAVHEHGTEFHIEPE